MMVSFLLRGNRLLVSIPRLILTLHCCYSIPGGSIGPFAPASPFVWWPFSVDLADYPIYYQVRCGITAFTGMSLCVLQNPYWSMIQPMKLLDTSMFWLFFVAEGRHALCDKRRVSRKDGPRMSTMTSPW